MGKVGKIKYKKPFKTQEKYEKEIYNIYGDDLKVIGKYIRAKERIAVMHKCGYIWNPIADSLVGKNHLVGCPKCSGTYRRTPEEYKNEIKNKNIEPLEDFVNVDTSIYHRCLICGHKWKVQPSCILHSGTGCPMCNGGTNTVIIGINDMWTTNPELASLLAYPEDGFKYTQSSNAKVPWRCKDCGKITKPKQISKVKARGLFCQRCSSTKSLPNRIMYNLLLELKIDFESEKIFDWCKFIYKDKDRYGIYDFYFEYKNKKYIVEMDGIWHKADNKMSGQTKEESEYIDKQKDILANDQGIIVIRINSEPSTTNNIKNNIINSKLNDIFDLNNINWNKCFYQSVTPIMKNVCDDFNNGFSVRELVKKYSKDIATIMKFLDIGTEANICTYKHEGNHIKIVAINNKKIFNSLKEASEYYDASTSTIRDMLKNKLKCAKTICDEDGIPIIFRTYDDYIKMSDFDILYEIQQATLNKFFKDMVICLNTKTIFKNQIKAKEWCGTSISGAIYNSEKCFHAGRHPKTKEQLSWLKLSDHIKLINNKNNILEE